MAEGNGSSNTAIVAIVVLVIIVLGLFYFFGGFPSKEAGPTTIEKEKNINIQPPAMNTGTPR